MKRGTLIHSVKTENIQLFYADGRTVFLITTDNDRYIIDYNLSELEDLLDMDLFYRVNRSYIVNINCIEKISRHSNSRLKLQTAYDAKDDIIVSREKVTHFKNWLGGKEDGNGSSD